MGATAFVADPAGNTDVQVHVQVGEQRVALAGKAVHHCAGQVVAVILEDRQQAFAGVAFVQEHRQTQLGSQCQLCLQGFFLQRARGEVAVEVQAAFTHGAYTWFTQQLAQLALAAGIPGFGIMRVYACRGEQVRAARIQLLAQLQRLFADRQAGARQHHLRDPGLKGALDDCRLLVVETAVGQVDADIDQLHGAISCRGAASIAKTVFF